MAIHSTLQNLIGAPVPEEQVLEQLKKYPESYALYGTLASENQKEFLDFCAGKTGLYLCYDRFFQHIFNLQTHRDRTEHLLSALLEQEVHILELLPREGMLITERGSLVIMDLVVQLEDNSIINLEIQKSGYKFPAQRQECYHADLIMRNYNMLKEKYKEKFTYQKLSPVISIVLIEESTAAFKEYPDIYIHHGGVTFDSGIRLQGYSRYIYVALDIFRDFIQNKPVENPLEAWLMLLSTRDLKRIEELIEMNSEFADIYREVFEFRTRPEEVLTMLFYSLGEADRCEERMMIQDMTEEIARQSEEIARQAEALSQKNEALSQKDEALSQQAEALSQKDETIAELEATIRLLKSERLSGEHNASRRRWPMASEKDHFAEKNQKLLSALVQLMKERDVSQITVTDLTREAGIPRTSFYRIYDGIREFVDETEKAILEALESLEEYLTSASLATDQLNRPDPRLLMPLRFLYSVRKLYLALGSEHGDPDFPEKKEYLMHNPLDASSAYRRIVMNEPDVYAKFVIAGHIAVVDHWLSERSDIPPERMCIIMQHLLFGIL